MSAVSVETAAALGAIIGAQDQIACQKLKLRGSVTLHHTATRCGDSCKYNAGNQPVQLQCVEQSIGAAMLEDNVTAATLAETL